MPGASLMIRASVPSTPLVISVSDPARKTRARPDDPDPAIALENPSDMDSTDTKTTTTPAIPIMATAEEPSRAGIVRRFIIITATVCLNHFTQVLLIPSQGVRDSQSHRPKCRHESGQETHQHHKHQADSDVLRRQREKREKTASRIATLHKKPSHCKAQTAAYDGNEKRLG